LHAYGVPVFLAASHFYFVGYSLQDTGQNVEVKRPHSFFLIQQ
jgi:hypothetical protein